MPEQDHYTGQVHHPQIVLDVIFVAHNQATEVVEPGEQALNFPPPLEATQHSAVLGLAVGSPTSPMRRDHLGAELILHLVIQRIAVVGLVTDQALWHIGNEALLHRLGHQLHFSWTSTFCAYGDRKTMAVCNGHELAAL